MNNISTIFKNTILTPFFVVSGKLIYLMLFSFSSAAFSADVSDEQNTNADSGMINREPLLSSKIKPSNLDRISTDISKITESLNNILTSPIEDEAPEEIKKTEEAVQKIQAIVAKPKAVKPKEIKIVLPDLTPEPLLEKTPITIKIPATTAATKPLKPTTTLKPIIKADTTPNAIAVNIDKKTNTNEYIKIGLDGKELPKNSETWTCVEDKNNGLIWEVKSQDGGIQDKNNSYTWFQPSSLEVVHGSADGGQCSGDIDCDSQSYVQAINEQNYCGYSDWRLPTREEMLTIVNMDGAKSKVAINRDYFPETLPSWYWTASSNNNYPQHAWYVLFRNGISINDLKEHPKHIRLVRSQTKKAS